ncbi:glutaredoxin domain-containing protein [Ligilactobacillus sp. LYQ135]
MIDVYYHSRCSTCKKAIKWLNENQIEYQLHDLLKNPPTKENLKNWITVSNLPLKNFLILVVNIIVNKILKIKLIK